MGSDSLSKTCMGLARLINILKMNIILEVHTIFQVIFDKSLLNLFTSRILCLAIIEVRQGDEQLARYFLKLIKD